MDENNKSGIPVAPVNPAAAAAPGVENPAAAAAPVINPGEIPTFNTAGMFQQEPVTGAAPTGTAMNETAGVAGGVPVGAPGMLGAMDPLTMPDKPAEPDPVEEELKAPLKAAAPVPGSIGSAVSVPAEGASAGGAPVSGVPVMPVPTPMATAPQSVSFEDPAKMPAAGGVAKSGGKLKMSKQTLVLLCVVAGIVVLALIIVLVMMLNGML